MVPNAHITPSLGGGNTVSTPGQGGTHITPSFGGGYTVSTPGQLDTRITPSFGGGYIVSTPGQLNTHITPSFGGGYTVSKPGQGDTHITPSFGGGYTVCFAAVIAAKEHRNIAALIAKIAPRRRSSDRAATDPVFRYVHISDHAINKYGRA